MCLFTLDLLDEFVLDFVYQVLLQLFQSYWSRLPARRSRKIPETFLGHQFRGSQLLFTHKQVTVTATATFLLGFRPPPSAAAPTSLDKYL